MIIYGTRGLTSTAGSGVFHCPRCGPNKPYAHMQVKRWFTLYFIPCIPLGLAGEYVECRQCAGTFGVEALHYDPAAEHRQTVDEIKRILVLTVLQAGPVHDSRLETLRSAIHGATDVGFGAQELRQDLELARQANARVEYYVPPIAAQFSTEGKNSIFSAAYFALSDVGRPGPQEVQTLTILGQALGFDAATTAHLIERLGQV